MKKYKNLCCDPFASHQRQIYSSLRVIPKKLCDEKYFLGIAEGSHVCVNCLKKIHKSQPQGTYQATTSARHSRRNYIEVESFSSESDDASSGSNYVPDQRAGDANSEEPRVRTGKRKLKQVSSSSNTKSDDDDDDEEDYEDSNEADKKLIGKHKREKERRMKKKRVAYSIRSANQLDCPEISKLIQELADYEDMSSGPQIGAETLQQDGFGKDSYFKCFVAEITGASSPEVLEIAGYTLYYFTYSTWQGKSIYMEDLYVTPKYRQHGIGQALWKSVVEEGLKRGCTRTDFAVLGWNTPSIEFYKKKGVVDLTAKEDWHLFRMSKEDMIKFVQE